MPDKIAIIDIDSKTPNLSLKKIEKHHLERISLFMTLMLAKKVEEDL